MSHPNRFLHADAAGSPALPSLTTTRRMTYIDYYNRFDELDGQQPFSASATRLYVKLLAECNKLRQGGQWPAVFPLSDRRLTLLFGGSLNTMKKARTELESRGLLTYQSGGNGAGDTCVYALQPEVNKVSNSDTFPANKVSALVSDFDTLLANKVSDKVSKSDTINKEQNTDSSRVRESEEEVGAAPSPSPAVEGDFSSSRITPQPASQKPVPGTEGGGRRAAANDDPADLVAADHCRMLTDPATFRAACIDEGYTLIDFEHYRLEILNTSRDESLSLPAFRWRKRLRRWLSNAKADNKLILAAVPGQTKGDPRAIKPLADRSSASPTKKTSWS